MSNLETCTDPSREESVYCKVCEEAFNTLQECLAHELIKHTIQPQKKLRKCIHAITNLFASEEIQNERRELQTVFDQAEPGQHLRAMLAFYSGNWNEMLNCFSDVRDILQNKMQGRIKVHPFGSLVTGLALRDSDIDLYVEQSNPNDLLNRRLFNRINNFLRQSDSFQDVLAIRHARVPIIRCKHVQSDLKLDINMSSPNSTYNSRFVADLLSRDVRIRELCLFLKLWAKKLKIIGSGSMTSYCLITLIIFGLQQRQLLPPIKLLQSRCPVLEVMGVNYAYSFNSVPPLPESLTTVELISSFFELYSTMDFEKKLLSPFLGYALDLETAFSVYGYMPDYEMQLRTMHKALGEAPEPFQHDRCVCIQDSFELQYNVAQSISLTNLCYLRECLTLAAEACKDTKLVSTPAKFYDYLLFGLVEKLLQAERIGRAPKAKQRRKMKRKPSDSESQPDATDAVTIPKPSATVMPKPKVESTASPAIAATKKQTPAVSTEEFTSERSTDGKERLSSSSSVESAKSLLMHVHTLRPTNNDLKFLRADCLRKNQNTKQTIFYYWVQYYVEAITDILTNIYGLTMKKIEPKEPISPNLLPTHYTWLISTSLDTWTARNFQRTNKESFSAQQIQQTIELIKTRSQCPNYAVNLSGRFSLVIGTDCKELRLELQPNAGNSLGLQRQSPLTKLFKSLKNMLSNYNFKDNFDIMKTRQT